MSHVAEALLPRPSRPRTDERFNALSFQLVTTPGSSDESSASRAEYAAAVAELAESRASALQEVFRELVAFVWVSELARDVRVTRRNAVARYLLRHPRFTPALRSIVRTVRQRVDEAILSVNQDPEIQDEYLTIEIRQHHYDDRFLELLESLQEEVVQRIGSGVTGWVLVTTDFRPPETRVAL